MWQTVQFELCAASSCMRKSWERAYTVNNMTDLCGGLGFSWSEWISLSALLCCSLSNKKDRTIAANCCVLKTDPVFWYSAESSPELVTHTGPQNRPKCTCPLYFSCHTSEKFATNIHVRLKLPKSHLHSRGLVSVGEIMFRDYTKQVLGGVTQPIVILLAFFLAVKNVSPFESDATAAHSCNLQLLFQWEKTKNKKQKTEMLLRFYKGRFWVGKSGWNC